MPTDDCVFCNIINRTLASNNIVEETPELIVLKDILPKAPVHLLVIPKKHIASVNDLGEADTALLGNMLLLARKMAKKFSIDESGYKLIFNVGRHGGQVVKHLHLHLLGGKQLPE
jgi:histidine triad (HIT) family protein